VAATSPTVDTDDVDGCDPIVDDDVTAEAEGDARNRRVPLLPGERAAGEVGRERFVGRARGTSPSISTTNNNKFISDQRKLVGYGYINIPESASSSSILSDPICSAA
jgi:hypothetical protein